MFVHVDRPLVFFLRTSKIFIQNPEITNVRLEVFLIFSTLLTLITTTEEILALKHSNWNLQTET